MAGQWKLFALERTFVPMGKRIYCSCHATWLPCKTSIYPNFPSFLDQDCTADNNDVTLNGSLPGSLVSPRFSHSTSLQCTWRLVAPPGMILSLTLSNISLSSNNYIVFLDGLQNSSKELARVTENASGVIRLHSGARYLLIKFVAKGSHNGTVFRLEYRSVYPGK